MSTFLVDLAVGLILFTLGIALTVFRFGSKDRWAFTVVAVLLPAIAVVAVFRLLYLLARHKVVLEPCPDGLEEAENIVERRRQLLFGGNLRQPSMSRSWKTAYERELQKESERLQCAARRYFAIA